MPAGRPTKKQQSKKAAKALVEAVKNGRPTEYKPEFNLIAYKLCLLGVTEAELADLIGISEATLANWKNKYPKFLEAIKDGGIKADAEVAESLRNRALGYTCPETKAQWVQDGKGGRWEYADLEKHYPPDTQAASLWLRNRQSAKWRDKIDAELSGPGGGPIETKWDIVFHDADAPTK